MEDVPYRIIQMQRVRPYSNSKYCTSVTTLIEIAASKTGMKLLHPNKHHQPRALPAHNATVQQ